MRGDIDAHVAAARERGAVAVHVAMQVEAAVRAALPLLDGVVEEHEALVDAGDAAGAHDVVDAIKQPVEVLLTARIVVAAHEVDALAGDAAAELLGTRARFGGPLVWAEEVAKVDEDVVRSHRGVDRVDHGVVHLRNALVGPREDADRRAMAEVRVGGDEDAPVRPREFLGDRHAGDSTIPPMHFIAALAAVLAASAPQQELPRYGGVNLVNETPEQHDARMRWFREAKFGMFIHWGAYSTAAGEWNGRPVRGIGEWLLSNAQIKPEDYAVLQQRFNPVKFDAKRWVAIAKDAGMKYIVITSKHHDGFCLWDSALTDWDVGGSPFAPRDPLKELADACTEAGIRLCFYHSIMDWHHPDYLPRRAWDTRPTDGAQYGRYIEYMKGQLKELTSGRYGKVGILWFDGEWEGTWTHEMGKDLYDYCRALDKDIIVNNRVDTGRSGMEGITREGDYRGDYGTPEQQIPATVLPAGFDWETCMTMNDTGGY